MLDINILKELFEDDDFIAKYLRLFLKDIDQQFNSIRGFVSLGEYQQAAIASHTIKGQLQYIGSFDAAKLAYELEIRFEGGDIISEETWWPVYQDLGKMLEVIIGEIRVWLENFEHVNAG